MKKEKVIIIKNKKIKNLRNQLRILLTLSISNHQSKLMKLEYKNRSSIKSKVAHQKIDKINLMEKLSILLCLHCGHRDKDMVFIPKMQQWLCIDCYAEIMHFDHLRKELDMTEREIKEFFDRLNSEEGISISKNGSKCHEYHYTKLILNRMGIQPKTQKKFLDLCRYYGGHCDCEIYFNARPRFLGYYS